jgi:hypothetical protein
VNTSSSVSQQLKTHPLQLPKQRIAHDIAAGAAGLDADGLELPLQVGFQSDGEGMDVHAPHCARGLGRGAGNHGLPGWPASTK